MASKTIKSTNWSDESINYQGKKIALNITVANTLETKLVHEVAAILSKKYNFVADPIKLIKDKSVLGGMKVEFDSKVIDGTLKARLNKIKNEIH